MLTKKRAQFLRRKFKAEYHFGQSKAGRIHVASSPRQVITDCLQAIAPHHRRTHAMRDARHAYFLGALESLAEWRETCAHFRI